MKPDCEHYCKDNWIFPKHPDNRPGLKTINYRIGEYSDFRKALMRSLNKNPVLAGWTHREADDPGIALLDGAAILGDILTFYQNLYANEAFLRTARWRESVAELVRLLGYRLSPGLGGKATFAFEVEGSKPVTIPKGFQVKAELEKLDEQATFESTSQVSAYPELSKFYLYRPLIENPKIYRNSTKEFYIDMPADGSVELEAEDRLLIGRPYLSFIQNSDRLYDTQIVTIDSVREFHGVKFYKIKGSIQDLNNLEKVTAYKLGRTFNHFGHNGPPKRISIQHNQASEKDVSFQRSMDVTWSNNVDPWLEPLEMPLDVEVNDISLGSDLIFQVALSFPVPVRPVDAKLFYVLLELRPPLFTLIRKATEIRKGSYTWGALTGSSTVLHIDKQLVVNTRNTLDIRQVRIHETLGPRLQLRAVPEEKTASRGNVLYFYDAETTALALKGRKVIFQVSSNEVIEASVNHVTKTRTMDEPFALHAPSWKVTLNNEVLYSNFPNGKEPGTVVFGNLVETTQGKTEKEKPLGNGDSRKTFQIFKLPKSPLAYLLDASTTPPEVPELKISVDDQLWEQVPSFYGHSANEQIYIVREDENNESWVQFGDGKTGARLPSGLSNVVARYRTGIGAHGPLKDGADVQAGNRLDKLEKIYMPGRASMGSRPEKAENARIAGPGKTQSLGRLVTIKDYESEALGISGVAKVKSEWGLYNNSPGVKLTILMESGKYGKYEDVQDKMEEFNRSRGPNRFPVIIKQGRFKYINLNLTAWVDKYYKQDQVKTAIKKALGVTGEEGNGIDGSLGLMGLNERQFGEDEYSERVLGVVQNVPGVVWVRISSFRALYGPQDPEAIDWPDVQSDQGTISARHQDVLALYKKHLKINLAEAKFKGDCV